MRNFISISCRILLVLSVVFIIGIIGGIDSGEPLSNMLYIPVVLPFMWLFSKFI